MFDPATTTAVILAGIGGVAWAVRVEGRVNNHDDLFEEREKLAQVRHLDLKDDLKRIESKLDRTNGTTTYQTGR